MSWRVSVLFAVSVSAGAMGVVSSPVHADEAYLCGPDKIVYVAAGDLEAMKRTDPCIAGYYGLTIDAPVPVVSAEKAAAAKAEAAALEKSATSQLKLLSDSEVPDRVTRATGRQASLEPPRAMPGTDYRNVKILNAAGPDAAWYRHSR